jgi:hypothetical protein
MQSLVVAASLVLTVCAALLATPASAGGSRGGQYVASFSCGSTDGSVGSAAGDYFTTISVLNAGSADVTTSARVTLTSASAGSDTVGATIAPGAALQLDCGELLGGIFTFPTPPTGFSDGFVVIQSSGPLHVVAHYTTSGAFASSQVVPIAASPSGKRARNGHKDDEEICHVPPGNASNEHTIRVSRSAVSAHMRHGDRSGECEDDDDDDDDDDHDDD